MNKFKSVYLTSRSFICMTGQVLAPALGWSFFFFFFFVQIGSIIFIFSLSLHFPSNFGRKFLFFYNFYLSFSTQGILVGS